MVKLLTGIIFQKRCRSFIDWSIYYVRAEQIDKIADVLYTAGLKI